MHTYNKKRRKETFAALVRRTVAKGAKITAQREREIKVKQAYMVGADKTQLWHPIWNPTPEERQAANVRELEYRARQPFWRHWGDIIRQIKAKKFRTRLEAAHAFRKGSTWIKGLLEVALAQGVLTVDDLKACFRRRKPRKRKKRGRGECGGSDHATTMLRLDAKKKAFETTFQQKRDCLTPANKPEDSTTGEQ